MSQRMQCSILWKRFPKEYVPQSCVYHCCARRRYTVPVNYAAYSYFILAFEIIGSSNTVLQGLYLLRRKEYHYGASSLHAGTRILQTFGRTYR